MKVGVSYFGCRRLGHIERELRELKAQGMDYLVFALTETDLLFYKDLMRRVLPRARELGLEVWADPWGVAGIFSGETASWFIPYHPKTWQVREDGVPVPHACPNAPGTREFVRRWIDAAAAAGAQWVLWDEPHFWSPGSDYWPMRVAPGHWACRCRYCREAFHRRYGHEMPQELTPEVEEFRRGALLSFLGELLGYAKEKGLGNAVCWAPPEQLPGGLTLEDVLELDGLDVLAIDPYWMLVGRDVEDFFRPWLLRARELSRTRGKGLQVWLQGFRVPRGREQELLEGARIAQDAGADYLAIWHHNGMSSLLPEDPAAVEGVIRGIIRLKSLSGRTGE